ncbi:hypothetical protein PAMP_011755 [Pampus punctatissimus]
MAATVKWLFVGLNLPWDSGLGSFDGKGTGGWKEGCMDGGGGSTVIDYRCKPLGSLPVGSPSSGSSYCSSVAEDTLSVKARHSNDPYAGGV